MHWYSRRTYTHMVILTVGILNFVNSYNLFFFVTHGDYCGVYNVHMLYAIVNSYLTMISHVPFVLFITLTSQWTWWRLKSPASNVYSGAYRRKHQSSTSLAFVWGIHQWPVDSPHKGPVTRKMVPFDDVIMFQIQWCSREAGNCQGLVSI